MSQEELFRKSPQGPTQVPLAHRLRPKTLDEFLGQEHILGPGKPLRQLIEQDTPGSLILWGPPGCGKTTLAQIIARLTRRRFEQLSAVTAGVADVRRVVELARQELRLRQRGTMLFIDEVHRFNKAQQDAILPHVEQGVLCFIGATTENPALGVIPPLRSRCRIYQLEPLRPEHIRRLILRALEDRERGLGELGLHLEAAALEALVVQAAGDARFALNTLEAAAALAQNTPERRIDAELVAGVLQEARLLYDRAGDEHYDHASAFQKSLRGSDPDAALYWLGKMIAAGEDPRFIARRLVVTAAEDVGLADPQALVVAVAAAWAAEHLGWPEARLPLAQAVLYVACAPKSNSTIVSIDKVLELIRQGGSYPVPKHLRDSHYQEARAFGHGAGYKYPHAYPGHYVPQDYLPPELQGERFFQPGDLGFEAQLKKWLERLRGRK